MKVRKDPSRYICIDCGIQLDRIQKRCSSCHDRRVDSGTLEDLIYQKHHKSSAFAFVRSRARTIARRLGFSKCINCGYDKHFEVGHIKPIHEFELTTLIAVINHPSNLVALCPNCHWEFDNGLLELALPERLELS